MPPFKLNPAKAQYLYGDTFYHVTRNCTTASPSLNYFLNDRKCYTQCPDYSILEAATFTCLTCHFSCKTCSVNGAANKCLTCDTSSRNFDSGSSKCLCPSQKYDDGVNLVCPSCSGT